jgi:thioesterase domain-containing protein
MADDRPVFGVFVDTEEQIASGERFSQDVPALAGAYLEALRTVRPAGPYILGGVSFGGVVAYEMAQQLLRSGESVRLLVLLDAILPRAWGRRGALDSVKSMISSHLLERVSQWSRRWPPYDYVRGANVKSSDRLEIQKLNRARDRAFQDALHRYDAQIEAYAGNVMIVRARREDAEAQDVDWHLGWAGLVPHQTPVFGVDGDHLGILVEPGASAIAGILRQQLA